eukprot:NODE_6540_length_448_cov_48.538847_g3202_i1.p2 GENE.NODE_6540_length_448_cov_48.538847_g3202_i1~~NODE_6540_length_448_cov_48.538847_g3202_i1.p2  ORF type:complete len:64 (-),score=16.82 NODE_6540_length_448_cov_48.538847_g3202_i1:3-194(-)
MCVRVCVCGWVCAETRKQAVGAPHRWTRAGVVCVCGSGGGGSPAVGGYVGGGVKNGGPPCTLR